MWVSFASSSASASASVSMEGNVPQVNNGLVNSNDERGDEHPEWCIRYDVFGDSEISPREGEEYQVELPPLISKAEYCSFQRNTNEEESSFHNFQVELPIPLIWIKDGAEKNNDDPLKDEWKSVRVINTIESSRAERIQEAQKYLDHEKLNPKLEAQNSDMKQEEQRYKGQILVPGSGSDTWTEVEEDGFLLALYIFGKNLVLVKRFIGNKKMEDILSFYYGEFYKSDKYQRWAGCRKMKTKSRKCIFGQRILTGPRHHEFLSRLLPNVSEKCANKLREVSKTFVEGKMLLEDYVLTLKALVGIKALVEAVGVGKGKQDITGLTVDSVKSTETVPVRREIPVGKACSKLTPPEIISFLTGDFRLSKARANDLFWEAVWPRLLARGWHSEQPRSYNYAATSKNTLVYLVPGVKKFSRKLVKGNHYFDSLSDVLGKVASDPELIDLETNADNDCTNNEEKLDRENSPADEPRHCYLKMKTPNRSTDVVKFTVVDTSLASEKSNNVRELRSLPFGVLTASTLDTDSDDESTSEEEITNESESANGTCFDSGTDHNILKGESSDLNGLEIKPSKEELPISSMVSTSLPAALIDQKSFVLDSKRRRNGMKCQSLQKIVSESDNIIDHVPITKKRRLSACGRAKKNGNITNFFVVPPRVKQEEVSFCPDQANSNYSENATADSVAPPPSVKQENASYCPYNPKSSDSVNSSAEKVIPPQENNSLVGFPTQEIKKSTDSQSDPSSFICREGVSDASSSRTKEQHQEPPKPWTMVDLNLPASPEVDEAFEMTEIPKSETGKELGEVNLGTNIEPVDHSDQQSDVQARRTSTRNRPPTTKVLEAFAFGFLDKKEKRSRSRDSSVSKPSRRVHRKVERSSPGVADSEKEERADVFSNGNGSASSNGDVLYTGFKQ